VVDVLSAVYLIEDTISSSETCGLSRCVPIGTLNSDRESEGAFRNEMKKLGQSSLHTRGNRPRDPHRVIRAPRFQRSRPRPRSAQSLDRTITITIYLTNDTTTRSATSGLVSICVPIGKLKSDRESDGAFRNEM
jgi:hypothetical protein